MAEFDSGTCYLVLFILVNKWHPRRPPQSTRIATKDRETAFEASGSESGGEREHDGESDEGRRKGMERLGEGGEGRAREMDDGPV